MPDLFGLGSEVVFAKTDPTEPSRSAPPPATDENVFPLGKMLTFIDRRMADVLIRGHLRLRPQESSWNEMRGRIVGLASIAERAQVDANRLYT